MKTIEHKDLEHLVKGACFLSSAGGGTYRSGMHLATSFGNDVKNYYEGKKSIEVVKVDELETEDYAVMVAYIGSPKCMEEIYYPEGIVKAVEKLAAMRNISVRYIIPPEIGAISMLAACTAAAKLNIAVVDGDGAGRAVPELSMTAFNLYHQDVNPVVLSSQEGENTLYMELKGGLNEADNVEKLIRPVLGMKCFGEMAGLAMWLVKGGDVSGIIKSQETISGCIELGKLLEPKSFDLSVLLEKASAMGYKAEVIAKGSNLSIFTDTGGGFDNGTLQFITSEGNEINILFKNESLIAWDSSQKTPLITAPDLISYIATFPGDDSQRTYSNGDLQQIAPDILAQGTIKLIKLKAPKWVWEQENCRIKLQALQIKEGKDLSSVQKSYLSVLRSLGYYGSICE